MSNETIEQIPTKLYINQPSDSSKKNSKNNLISNLSRHNTDIKDETPNYFIDEKELNIFLKEFQNIAKTGDTKYTWDELKNYVIYLYEKNVKILNENKKMAEGSNIEGKNDSGLAEINFHNFQNKKENKGLDLNINNENEFDEDKHMNMNLNLMNEFHFSEDNHYDNDMELNIHEQNANFLKVKKNTEEEQNYQKDIIECINKIKIMPFTLQRIAELLLEPEKYYKTVLKYNRAFYKLVNIDFY